MNSKVYFATAWDAAGACSATTDTASADYSFFYCYKYCEV